MSQPHSHPLLESSWLPLRQGQPWPHLWPCPFPWLPPPISRRGPGHQQHLGWARHQRCPQTTALQLTHKPVQTSWAGPGPPPRPCSLRPGELESAPARARLGPGGTRLCSPGPCCQTLSVGSARPPDHSPSAALPCTHAEGQRWQCLIPLFFCLLGGTRPWSMLLQTRFAPLFFSA